MPTGTLRRSRRGLGLLIPACLLSGPVFAADAGGLKGAAVAILGGLLVAVLVQFLLAILLPRFTHRLQRAIAGDFWPCTGWGALVAVLAVVVGAVLGQGGQAGKTLVSLETILLALLAVAGSLGVAKAIGDWALRRWEVPPQGPLSVLCGGVVWWAAGAIPVVGWAAALLSLLASLGAVVQVLLQPHSFDPPAPAGNALTPPPPPGAVPP